MGPATPAPMRIVPLDQNSDAWLEWRRTGIGSSDAPAVLGLSPWKTRHQLWQEKVLDYHSSRPVLPRAVRDRIRAQRAAREGQNESSKNRGKKLEPVCRAEYERLMGWSAEPVCGVHDTLEYLKVSLDGWNQDRRLFLEIKAPNQKAHEEALAGRVPHYYVPQVLHQFATTDARVGHYVSFHDRYPPGQRLAIVVVNDRTAGPALASDFPLADQVAFVREALADFWDAVVRGAYVPLDDEEAATLALTAEE